MLEPEALAALGGIITAAGAAVWKLSSLFLEHLAEQRREFTVFLGNHMSENRRAVEASVKAAQRVADHLEALEDAVERHRRG